MIDASTVDLDSFITGETAITNNKNNIATILMLVGICAFGLGAFLIIKNGITYNNSLESKSF